jgi:putative membrane protein
MRKISDYALLMLKGIAMGAADIVPGVSGGTIAFITGIYQELINSIKSVDATAFKLLFSFRFNDLWRHVNGNFLAILLLGIAISIFSFASLITYLLANHPIQVWSFFFGLIIISTMLVIRQIYRWSYLLIPYFLVAAIGAYFLTTLNPIQIPDGMFFTFLSGAIAICAMILPGISGSFILLILGKYSFILEAAKTFNIPVLLVFMVGCIVGILSFSRLINWLLDKRHDITIAALAGFMIGSLGKVWPWKIAETFRLNSKGVQVPLQETNILPNQYMEITNSDPHFGGAILFFALGLGLVVVIEKVTNIIQNKS